MAGFGLGGEIAEMEQRQSSPLEHSAATKIQASFRGYRDRQLYNDVRVANGLPPSPPLR